MDSVSSDIQMNNCGVVLGKDLGKLLEAMAGEAVLADVDLGEPFVVFEDFGYDR